MKTTPLVVVSLSALAAASGGLDRRDDALSQATEHGLAARSSGSVSAPTVMNAKVQRFRRHKRAMDRLRRRQDALEEATGSHKVARSDVSSRARRQNPRPDQSAGIDMDSDSDDENVTNGPGRAAARYATGIARRMAKREVGQSTPGSNKDTDTDYTDGNSTDGVTDHSSDGDSTDGYTTDEDRRHPQPVQPGQPVLPVQPGQPGHPVKPGQPDQPIQPPQPGQPGQPDQPVQPGQPGQPGQPVQPGQPTPSTSPGSDPTPSPIYSPIPAADGFQAASQENTASRYNHGQSGAVVVVGLVTAVLAFVV